MFIVMIRRVSYIDAPLHVIGRPARCMLGKEVGAQLPRVCASWPCAKSISLCALIHVRWQGISVGVIESVVVLSVK
jgi:hypothetical protein